MEEPKITRDQASITFACEKRALLYIAQRLPLWISPDSLTGLGIIAALIIGTSYLFAQKEPLLLWVAAGGWVLHWFGDSLDGTVARARPSRRANLQTNVKPSHQPQPTKARALFGRKDSLFR